MNKWKLSQDCKVSDIRLNDLKTNNKIGQFTIFNDPQGDYYIYYNEDAESDIMGTPLCNFLIIPVERIQNADGLDIRYIFHVCKNREKYWFVVELEMEELNSSKWIEKVSTFLELYPKKDYNYSKLKNYLFYLLEDEKWVRTVVEYDTIGWVKHKNRWVFLHGDGAIGDIGKDEVTTKMKEYKLYYDEKEEESICCQRTFEMLDICSRHTTLPLFCFTLVSLMTTPLRTVENLVPIFNMWLYGFTGYGKTSLAYLFTKVFDASNIIRVDSSRKSIKESNKIFKDSVLIVDDFGVAKTKNREAIVAEKVEDLLRGMSDRGKLADGDYTGDGVVLFTGEKFLGMGSNNEKNYLSSIDRCFRVEMDNILNARITISFSHEKKRRLLYFSKYKFMSTSLMHFIEWLAEKLNEGLLDKEYIPRFERYMNELEGENSRTINAYAHLMTSFDLYLQYAMERCKLPYSKWESEKLNARSLLFEIAKGQKRPVPDKGIVVFFFCMKEMIKSNQLRFAIDSFCTIKDALSKDEISGVLLMKKGVLQVKLSELFEKVSDYLEEEVPGLRPELPDYKPMLKKLRENRYLIEKDYDRTYSTSTVLTSGQKPVRVAELRCKYIKEITDAILEQNRYQEKMENMDALAKMYSSYSEEEEIGEYEEAESDNQEWEDENPCLSRMMKDLFFMKDGEEYSSITDPQDDKYIIDIKMPLDTKTGHKRN